MQVSLPLNHRLHSKVSLLLAALALAALILPLEKASAAVVVNIDINGNSSSTLSGQGAYSDPGNNLWNGFDLVGVFYTGTVTTDDVGLAVKDSTGAASTIKLSLTSVKTQNIIPINPAYSTGNALLDDYVYSDSQTTSSFVISGLTPGAAYALYLYGDQANIPGNGTTYIVGGVSQSVAGRALGTDPYTSYALGKDYTLYSSVTADGLGQIGGSFAAQSGTFGFFDGLQIVAVPEPQTWALAALGVSAVVFRLRRKVAGGVS